VAERILRLHPPLVKALPEGPLPTRPRTRGGQGTETDPGLDHPDAVAQARRVMESEVVWERAMKDSAFFSSGS